MGIKIIRIVLCVILLADAVFIFWNSSREANESGRLSLGITETVAGIFVPEIDQMDDGEREAILEILNRKIRESAHLLQFVPMGFSLYGLLLSFEERVSGKTWKKRGLLVLAAIAGGLLYALSDEIHQYFVPGRAFQLFDIVMDMLGVILGCACALLILPIYRSVNKKTKETRS